MEKIQHFYKKKKIGIEILRALLCLWIVILHCSKISTKQNKYLHRGFHVPTFFMMAFYFYYPILYERIIIKISNRICRLLIPYIIWPVFSFILNNSMFEIFSAGQYNFKIPLKELFLQIIFGARFHWIFWFQFNLIISTLLFTILSFLFKKKLLTILCFLGIICLYLHFSNFVYNILKTYREFIYTTLGSTIELIPLAVIGCIYKSFNLLSKINNIPLSIHIALISLVYIFFKYDLFIPISGFRYPYILSNITVSTLLLIIFNSILLKENILFSIIDNITKFTGGIYYIHIIIRDYLSNFLLIKDRNYLSGFIIYIICYIICFIGIKIFQNSKLKYLFI